MKYVSSRNCKEVLSSHEAIIKGLANDGGLYTPEKLDKNIEAQDILGLSYQEAATKIISAMLDDYSEEEIHACIEQAYDSKFDSNEIVPLTKINSGWLMELWHGPTSAFKDIALTLLPSLMTCAYQKENRSDTISILTATSGDTGKAAISGFSDVPHTAITVFYPEIGVSPIQKLQMQTSKGKNVEVIAVKGNFDDCQRLIKEATSNKEVLDSLDHVIISSANSINIGRLTPQIVYYYTSYAKLVDEKAIQCGDPVNFVVPTGNFGDILAGYLAKQLGLPIHKLICASNENNVLTDFLNTGTYSTDRPFYQTMSPSMDILVSSNLERLLFMMSNNDDQFVTKMMEELKEKGTYQIPDHMLSQIQQTFSAYCSTDNECEETIHELYQNEKVLIDPHTAVALHCMYQYKHDSDDNTPCVVLSTASPYKFSKDVLKCISDEKIENDFAMMDQIHAITGIKIPEGLAQLKDLPVRFNRSIAIKDGMHVIAERMKEISHDQD